MDRITTILRYEWRAFWRRFSRAGNLTAGNQGIALVFSGLILIKYLGVLQNASSGVAKGRTALLQSLLAGIFVAWLFPLASNARASLATRTWLHLPLSLKERFIVRMVSLLMPPFAWMVLLGSLAICYPLSHARNPLAGILAGLLFIATSWFAGLAIAHLLSIAIWRKVFWVAVFALLAFVGSYVMRGKTAGALLTFSLLPTNLVTLAAMGTVGKEIWIALGTLAIVTVVAGAAAVASFRLSLAAAPEVRAQRAILASARLPGQLGGLVAKDLRYFRRLLDAYLALSVAMLGSLYLATAEVPGQGIFLSFIVIVFLLNAALAFNSFGLDTRAGLDRYTLLPLSGKAILMSKNLAYLMILGFQVLPMIVLAGWRLGMYTSALGLVEAIALACAYLAWGNWMSVNHPVKMQFFRFASSGAALVDSIGGIVFGSLPGLLVIYLLQMHAPGAFGKIALVLLVYTAFYFVSVARFGRRLEQSRERIARVLSSSV